MIWSPPPTIEVRTVSFLIFPEMWVVTAMAEVVKNVVKLVA